MHPKFCFLGCMNHAVRGTTQYYNTENFVHLESQSSRVALKIFANLKNISDETSKCSHFSSTGSILANFFLEIIIIDMGNTLYLLESRLKVIRGPELFSPLRLNISSERTSSVRLTTCDASQVPQKYLEVPRALQAPVGSTGQGSRGSRAPKARD